MDEVVRALEQLLDSDDKAGGVGSSRDQTVKRNGHSSSSSGPRQHRGRQHGTTHK
ncbi:kinase APK1A [Spatholobus suberectus]|nr:kinase APK1A [Spatholobus suberectus]